MKIIFVIFIALFISKSYFLTVELDILEAHICLCVAWALILTEICERRVVLISGILITIEESKSTKHTKKKYKYLVVITEKKS